MSSWRCIRPESRWLWLLRLASGITCAAGLSTSSKVLRGDSSDVVAATVTCTDLIASQCRVGFSEGLRSRASPGLWHDQDGPGTASAAKVDVVFNKSINETTGFSALEIRAHRPTLGAQRENAPELFAYAAGFAEGYTTAAQIALYYYNVYEFREGGPPQKLVEFVLENDRYVRERAKTLNASSDYWAAIGSVLARFDGILAGYSKAAKEQLLPSMTKLELLWINLDGDLFDLLNAFDGSAVPEVGRVGRARRWTKEAGLYPQGLRCSALFRLAADKSDLFFSHDTWDTYATAAPRIYKHVELPVLRAGSVRMRLVSFSSSPGMIPSIDDYYVISETGSAADNEATSLAVIETSLNVDNRNAYKALTPKSVLYWLRVMASSALATNAPSWARLYEVEKSGTYCNQWMVLDINKFEAGKDLPKDTFWVLEEVPGLIVAEDKTDVLMSQGYWPSYNVAYYEKARQIAHETQSWEDCPRARLFREMVGNVTDIESMKWIMTWNNWQHDPISKTPSDAIMARGDLPVANDTARAPRAGGGIDSKVSSALLQKSTSATYVIGGPTHEYLPPFCWTVQFDSTAHRGHPRCFDFRWGVFAPQESASPLSEILV
eukprot:TRINITY_DN91515_c0_g1_i1.p1 TRINITY_DN91515_c0_g1~~TRINITY_DN91515_c0_g1_i1.p1  ORF type:complete len:627 (+),score=68.27 TRINITY_DN91515_c0_g1_i1:65-1882(+)